MNGTFFENLKQIIATLASCLVAMIMGCAPNFEIENNKEVIDNDDADLSYQEDQISPDRQLELENIAQQWLEDNDNIDPATIENQLESRFIEDILDAWQDLEEGNDDHGADPPVMSLAGCGGYWGTYTALSDPTTFAENMWTDGSYSYRWSPNCSMAAPGGDCGTDHDDNMVSFWMGPDYTLTEAAYRVDSNSWATYWNLLYHGGASYRVYTSNAYGSWFGNAYVCLSNSRDPNTLRFGRDY